MATSESSPCGDDVDQRKHEAAAIPAIPMRRIFSLRIVTMDYYMACPLSGMDACYSPFQGQPVAEVPVVRIFGSTLAGQKTCLHLHNAFPYFYVPYDDDLPQNLNEALAFARRLASAIEKALKLASSIGAKRQHVHSCSLVRAKKFYGYHPFEQLFVKIVLYYPHEVSRLSALLLGGGILNRSFQPHESHIPYILQVLIDHNLAGMGYIHVSNMKFRQPLPEDAFDMGSFKQNIRQVALELVGSVVSSNDGQNMDPFTSKFRHLQQHVVESSVTTVSPTDPAISVAAVSIKSPVSPVFASQSELWLNRTVPLDWIWSVVVSSNGGGPQEQGRTLYSKQSTCELEADASVEDILNREELLFTPLAKAGPKVKMVQSLTPIWEEENARKGHEYANIGIEENLSGDRVVQAPAYEQEYRRVLNGILFDERQWSRQVDKTHSCMQSDRSIFSNEYQEGSTCDASLHKASGIKSNLASHASVVASRAQDPVLKCTQAAYYSTVCTGAEGVNASRIFSEGKNNTIIDDITGYEDDLEGFVNEEVVKTQVTQSKELEQEAIDLLRWMISSQQDDGGYLDAENEKVVDETLWSQNFHSADEALAKAVLDYENTSQQECQAILECVENVGLEGQRLDLQEAGVQNEMNQRNNSMLSSQEAGNDKSTLIPQFDGAYDEDLLLSEQNSQEKVLDAEGVGLEMKQGSKDFKIDSQMLSKEGLGHISFVHEPVEKAPRSEALWGTLSLTSRDGSLPTVKETGKIVAMETCCLSDRMKSDGLLGTDCKTQCNTLLSSTKTEKKDLTLVSIENREQSLRDMMRTKRKRKMAKESIALESLSGRSACLSNPLTSQNRHGMSGELCPRFGPLPFVRPNFGRLKRGPKDDFVMLSDGQRVENVDPVKELASLDQAILLENTVEKDNMLVRKNSCNLEAAEDTIYELKCDIMKEEDSLPSCYEGAIVSTFKEMPSEEPRQDILPSLKGNVLVQQEEMGCTNLTSVRKPNLGTHGCEACVDAKDTDLFSERSKVTLESVTGNECVDEAFRYQEHNTEDLEISSPLLKDFGSGNSNMEINSRIGSVDLRNILTKEVEGSPLIYWRKPPTVDRVCTSFDEYGLLPVDHGEVFYGNSHDIPDQPTVRAGLVFEAKSLEVSNLPPFVFGMERGQEISSREYTQKESWGSRQDEDSVVGVPVHFQNDGAAFYLLTPVKTPPSAVAVSQWLWQLAVFNKQKQANAYHTSGPIFYHNSNLGKSLPLLDATEGDYTQSEEHENAMDPILPADHSKGCTKLEWNSASTTKVSQDFSKKWRDVSQITAPSLAGMQATSLSQSGFRDPASVGCGQQLLVMSIEVHAGTRGDLRPDPRYDSISCIILVFHNDDAHAKIRNQTVVLLHDDKTATVWRNLDALDGCEVVTMKDELTLLHMFILIVRLYDPDIVVGWEIQGFSLGLLAERSATLGIGLLKQISRTPPERRTNAGTVDLANENDQELRGKMFMTDVEMGANEAVIGDEWGRTHGSGIYVGGRVVLNLWRIIRGELKLGIYTLEAVAEAVLKRKVPRFSWRVLTHWFSSGPGRARFHCIEYFVERAKLNLQIMDQLDLLNRTSELARVFGIDFFSVLSRGSQYRVESMMTRLAHSQNFLLIAPSRQQVASQPAMQCLPLVMEPESRFYTDPVVVLDFQSLYPSIIIAYNLCYSTCLGKLVPDNPKVLGVTSLSLQPEIVQNLKDSLKFTPNGIIYTPPEVCPGVLPRLLQEILSTRIMVKQAIKKLSTDQKVLRRVLNARQLALKLIANVTYGYTAAGFSGRMPCAEVADSIVQTGRHTLEKAINFINSNLQWKAHVVYGDTDSVFVLLRGRTREDAFKIGQEIASAVTAMNPRPVTLKMEKVYHPCVLLTKKRYVGYSYESFTQVKPTFDAKGIETVRRDSCGAVAKTMERSLRILFETQDLSQVKQYLQRQWSKIIGGHVSLKDFIFAKEVRLGTYSARASFLPPAAIVATKTMSIDPRAEPRYGERIPYIVVHGEPGARLVDMVVDPHVLIDGNSAQRLHDTYYITKQIVPALQRVLGLVGVDLKLWYNEMPRQLRPSMGKRPITVPVSPSKSMELPSSIVYQKHVSDNIKNQKGTFYKWTIDHYYLSQHCTICGALINASNPICEYCWHNKDVVVAALFGRTSRIEEEFKHLQQVCRHCGGADTDVERAISCISLDCSLFFDRKKVEKEFKTSAVLLNQCGIYPPYPLDLEHSMY